MDTRRTDPEQAPRLKQGADAAKGYWGYEDAWMLRWESVLTVAPEYMRANDVYVAVEGGEITAFYAFTLHGVLSSSRARIRQDRWEDLCEG
jgi:hypothetical protein